MLFSCLTFKCENYVQENWVYSEKTSFEKKHLLARGVHLILAPASFITKALDTIIGIGAGIGTVLTFGRHEKTSRYAYIKLRFSRDLLANPYKNILRTINPEAKFSDDFRANLTNKRNSSLSEKSRNKQAFIKAEGNGFVSHKINFQLRYLGTSCSFSKNFLSRHVASRLTYALLAISSLVTRAIDGMFAIPATALSILTRGKFETLNNLSYRTLQATGIIDDLYFSTIKFINPWTQMY